MEQTSLFSPRERAWRDSIRSEEAQRVFERISYPEVRTAYPPLAQGLFALAQGLTPWSLLGWRLLVLLADLASLALIVGILSKARLPVEWALLYGWSPLILGAGVASRGALGFDRRDERRLRPPMDAPAQGL